MRTFPVWRAVAVPSRTVDFFARPGTHAASCIAVSCIANQVAAIFHPAAPHSCCPGKASSASLLPRERRCCCSVADHRYDRCCLGGFDCNRWSIYGAKKSLNRAGDRETHTIRLLPNRPRLGNYAKFALSFDKLPKLQTSNVKSLDTSFCDFLANYKNANPKCKTIGDTLSYFLSIFNDLCIHLKIRCDRES